MTRFLQWGITDQRDTEVRVLAQTATRAGAGVLRSRVVYWRERTQPILAIVDTYGDLAALFPTANNGYNITTYPAGIFAAETPANSFLARIGDEEFWVLQARHINENRWELWLFGRRGLRDTTMVAHEIGEQVRFTRSLHTIPHVYLGEHMVAHTSRDSTPARTHDILPAYPEINRVSIPPVPDLAGVAAPGSTALYNDQLVIGPINISFYNRSRRGQLGKIDDGQKAVLEIYNNNNRIVKEEFGKATYETYEYHELHTASLSAANIKAVLGGVTAAKLTICLYATLAGARSWKTAKYVIDWVESINCIGWGCDWNNHWNGTGDSTDTGWGENWGEDYSGP